MAFRHASEVNFREHDATNVAKRVAIVSGAVGNATVNIAGSATIYAVVNTSAAGQASVVLDTGTKWVGLATVNLGASLPAGTNAIGKLAANSGVDIGDVDVTSISAGSNFIGLISAASVHGTVEEKTSKTLSQVAIAVNTSGYSTIFVPTNTFKVTHLALSANATVGVRIMSGATYLTGNASLNMTLFPGGGIVENGQLLNPVHIGATAADGFVLDLDDSIEVAGKVVYYEE